jgi:hypothetical protein
VVHYLVDFGKSLGANATLPRYDPDGHAARVDLVWTAKSLATLGLVRRPWEGTYESHIDGVGRIDVEHFVPNGFNPQQPYRPFEFVDRLDGFWAAKLVMRFSPDHIRAAVEQGRFDDPRAIDYLTSVLVGRQQKLARYWFRQVSPLDRFALEAEGDRRRLCFSDLMVEYNLDPERTANTLWSARAYDFEGRSLSWSASASRAADTAGTACIAGFPFGRSHREYTIVRIAAHRHGRKLPPVDVHMARDPNTQQMRVIGISRK